MILIFWVIFFCILGIILTLLLIFGFPRKKSERIPNEEGIFDKEVADAFQKMTNFLPFRMLHNKVVKQLKKMNPQGKLVDIGCGAGNVLIKIAKALPHLDLNGLDMSIEILELARKKAIKNGFENKIEFKPGSGENLPFEDNSVDFIVSTLSLHHWLEPIRVFNEIERVLKDNGVFLLFDFRRDARKFFHGFLKFVTKIIVPKPLKKIKEPYGSISAAYTPLEFRKIIEKTKLKSVDIKGFYAWMLISNKKM